MKLYVQIRKIVIYKSNLFYTNLCLDSILLWRRTRCPLELGCNERYVVPVME
jgi:hypothetical protein